MKTANALHCPIVCVVLESYTIHPSARPLTNPGTTGVMDAVATAEWSGHSTETGDTSAVIYTNDTPLTG